MIFFHFLFELYLNECLFLFRYVMKNILENAMNITLFTNIYILYQI